MTPPPFLLILITFLLLRNFLSRVAAQCGLNLSAYPYVGYAECGWVQDQMDHWDGFPNTLCCRNALTVFSQALALRARTQTSLFIPDTEWHSCSDAFRPSQAISPDSCGFHNLYFGAFKCSNLKLSDIQSLPFYQPSLDQCSHFDRPSPDSCAHCVSAVLNIRDSLYNQLVGSQDIPVERAVCGVASLVSLAAGKPDDPSLSDKFLRCWPPPPNHDHPAEFLKWFSIVALLAVIAMALTAILVRCVWQKKPRDAAALKEITTWSGMYWFSKAEIENAISHGNERKCLGRGSAGQVFKGVLPSGQVVAIKHLNKTNSSDSFTREVEGLSRLRHPNLVCLFGCCIEDGERYLVYEYCAQGNLAQHLLRRDSHLTWETRVRILRDCSFALKYLHNHIEGCVVHRDIKLTNILLTESLQAKLSDFGLAKMLGMEESKVFTDVRGTIGYMDPEYMSNAKLTCASDVYSFGIVALQILSGQKVIELDLDARDQLTRKARDASSQKRPISDFEDPRLRGQVNMADFEAILRIAVLCVAKSSKGRPTIEEVFEELDKAYKNTLAQSKAKQDESKSGTSDLIIT